ncbi:signal recognition particle subunit SRP19/SEC65 family protein [Methanoregula sp.]|uniref:signal recognition particle subunit SRP19/SEC65 family protein n=1 Tax=Methanoregula sp. TaxID=2052170 RepID=UPI003BAE3C4F
MEKGECILYPCYFNASLSRDEGRRVPRTLGVKGPGAADIERALKRLGIACQAEEHHHPAYWARHEGRVVATYSGKKTALIKKVARNMEVKR